jgi:hypothetical protein
LVGMVLEKRFGPLSTPIREQLEKMSETELIDLALKIGTAKSLGELGLAETSAGD